jgi:hypothetical protein
MALDRNGNVYVTGAVSPASSFRTTPGAFQPSSLSKSQTGVVAKLNASGSAWVFATYLGGTGGDWPGAIAIDDAGNAFVTGFTNSVDFPVTRGAFQTSPRHTAGSNSPTAFVAKLETSGSSLSYATYLGGSGVTSEHL